MSSEQHPKFVKLCYVIFTYSEAKEKYVYYAVKGEESSMRSLE
jgi:hypothetical protein